MTFEYVALFMICLELNCSLLEHFKIDKTLGLKAADTWSIYAPTGLFTTCCSTVCYRVFLPVRNVQHAYVVADL